MASHTERIGIAVVSKVCEENNWFFREQPISDIGIDAIIERYNDKTKESKLIALQIKTGVSYFNEQNSFYVFYRISDRHYNYWIKYSIPVIIVLYNPETMEMVFSEIDDSRITKAGVEYKLHLNKREDFASYLNDIALRLVSLPNALYNYNYMLTQLPFMEAIKDGKDVILNSEEWINKSSGRGNIKITISTNNKSEIYEWGYYFPHTSYDKVFRRLFPWAKFVIDRDFLEGEELYYAESGSIISNEYLLYTKLQNVNGDIIGILRAGEVAFYKFYLELNEFGENFLSVNTVLPNLEVYKRIEISKVDEENDD
ncbi:MAG: DUF4365 domain-containing protein [Acholeplasmataceae bacterium]